MSFQPDYRQFLSVLKNERPERLPLYEHTISPLIMEQAQDIDFAALKNGSAADRAEFFRNYCQFYKDMTYDVVSYEMVITNVLPDHGALRGGKPGPIQSRADFEAYPWRDIPKLFDEATRQHYDAFTAAIPAGMKAVGGVGNGVFEISEDLVGLEYLPFMQIDAPELYADLYTKIGDLMVTIWTAFLDRYADDYAVCRIGDDLGFKASLLTNPQTVREHVLPQYKRLIDLIHSYGKPFLWHSCGNIFEVMDDFIALGIDAKHSNEDAIAPFDEWIDKYGDRIGLLGGFDMVFLGTRSPGEVYDAVVEAGTRFRAKANGYALGSGNSIPEYVPVDNYLAMVRGAQEIRKREAAAT